MAELLQPDPSRYNPAAGRGLAGRQRLGRDPLPLPVPACACVTELSVCSAMTGFSHATKTRLKAGMFIDSLIYTSVYFCAYRK